MLLLRTAPGPPKSWLLCNKPDPYPQATGWKAEMPIASAAAPRIFKLRSWGGEPSNLLLLGMGQGMLSFSKTQTR